MSIAGSIAVLINQSEYLEEFVRLNEAWISRHFKIEEADIKLSANPAKIIEDGGYIFTLLATTEIVGVCALFKEQENSYQLARMAVAREHQGHGYGNILMDAAIAKLLELKAKRVYLLSNTILVPAITLYKKYGFMTVSEGQHPVYARCNIVMEKNLPKY